MEHHENRRLCPNSSVLHLRFLAERMSPEIQIQQGFAIGYPDRALLRSTASRPLAVAKRPLRLTTGRHLLLARNGRGKTTLLKTLARLLPELEGQFSARGQVQYVHEELSFDPELTSRQIFGAFFGNPDRAKATEYADRLELDTRKPYGKLSKGNRQKVNLILAETFAAGGEPCILLLDEPFSGIDYHARHAIDSIWNENTANILRLVCVHPDEPTLQAQSALLIRDGEIEHVEVNGELDWLETRKCLN